MVRVKRVLNKALWLYTGAWRNSHSHTWKEQEVWKHMICMFFVLFCCFGHGGVGVTCSAQGRNKSGTQKLPQNSTHKKQIEKILKQNFILPHFTIKSTPPKAHETEKILWHKVRFKQSRRSHCEAIIFISAWTFPFSRTLPDHHNNKICFAGYTRTMSSIFLYCTSSLFGWVLFWIS